MSNENQAVKHNTGEHINTPVSGQGMKYTIAKYLTIVLIGIFVAMMILSQKQSGATFEDVRSKVEAAIDHETMIDAGTKGFRRYYKLKEQAYDGVMVYQSLSGISADEVVLVKVKDRDQIEELTKAIEERRESRINDFAGYAPEEEAIMKQAELLVKGNYVLFLPCRNAPEIKEAFLHALGD